MVVVFWKVKVTRLGILVSNASIMYCWSFLSAAVSASGKVRVNGFCNFVPRELSVMVTVFTWLLPSYLFLEFFASLAEAHTLLYL